MSEVLGCFLKHDDGVYKYELLPEDNGNVLSKKNKDNPNVIIKTYLLYSQKWPIGGYKDMPTTVWRHKLVFYIPKQISYSKVLLYVSGGRSKNITGVDELLSPKEQIDYVNIAINNKAPVVELQTVPNQYLFFNNLPLKEDQILAYTYKKFIDNPSQNAYLAGHLPMAKSVVKAMDAVQTILNEEHNITVTGFVLSGASKRGWAAWLVALEDDRVEAIIPIVTDILNTQKSMDYICRVYGGVCPPALKDYKEYNITKVINDPIFSELMEIEDPYNYLQDGYDAKYKARLAIPKYIINSSGDDFFVPDSSKWYFKNLPGDNNYIRYLPNAMHYFKGNEISDVIGSLKRINAALNSYFYFILNDVALPNISWKFYPDKVELSSSLKPDVVKLWVSNNKYARDFRFITSYPSGSYISNVWVFVKKNILSKAINSIGYSSDRIWCNNCYREKTMQFDCKENAGCNMQFSLPPFEKGWQASFVELHYNIKGIPFVVTTEVNITPDTLSPAVSTTFVPREEL